MRGRFLEAYILWIRRLLPSPLSIAIILTLVTMTWVFLVNPGDRSLSEGLVSWANGLWQPNLLVFAVQMMLILVLGHTLALSSAVSSIINKVVAPCRSSAKAAAIVAFTTMCVGLFNWGLGLIFGAIMARKVAEKATREGTLMNYGLVGAAGYSALLIWHGGLSGSSLIKVAEPGHLASLVSSAASLGVPDSIPLSDTVLSPMNIAIAFTLLIVVPAVLYFIGKIAPGEVIAVHQPAYSPEKTEKAMGAERIDQSNAFTKFIGLGVLAYCLYQMVNSAAGWMGFFTPNNINFMLLGLCFLAHRNLNSFTVAAEDATKGASGILIQFPLYFGILALMSQSGMIGKLSSYFIEFASAQSYPVLTLVSAGVVNLFVPSGGGQWALQGPIIIESSNVLNVPLHKSILAMAYGDQVTNMLQPFWALPLLGVTGLSARDILPYTLVMFLCASCIFIAGLLIF